MTPAASSEVDALRQAGLRATAPRTAVLTVLRDARAARGHLTAGQVATAARASLGSLSTQAVYDSLEALVGVGLARRLRLPDASSATYEAVVDHDDHDHLVCRTCGLTVDVVCPTRDALAPAPDTVPAGFTLSHADVVFWGTCPSCAPSHTSLETSR